MTNIDLAEKQKELLPALLIGKPAKSFISTFFDFILFGHQDLETISEDASSPGKILYNIFIEEITWFFLSYCPFLSV